MLTKVRLEGSLGKRFGRDWEFDIQTPIEALRMIDANVGGVFAWIKQNLKKYDRYRVICTYEDGSKDSIGPEELTMNKRVTMIRFVPILEGSSAAARFVIGAILVVVGTFMIGFSWGTLSGPGGWMVGLGASMMVGSAIEMLSPKPNLNGGENYESKNKTSRYFDGPVNTTAQGVPVPLIYGEKILVGSHSIYGSVTIQQLK